jgi:hypothetical protein
VRRSSDNAEQDIGFSAGELDQTALLAFVGLGNGFVTVWYDQSGFGRNAAQTTPANQPRIVNAGVVETQNGKPAIFLNGTNSVLRQTTLIVSNPYSINVVASRTASNGGYQRLINFSATGDAFCFVGAFQGNYATFTGNGAAWNDVAANTQNISIGNTSNILTATAINGANGLSPFVNSVAQNRKTGTTSTASGFLIGAAYNSTNVSQLWTGYISEFEVFPSALSYEERQSLECNQASYYTVTISPQAELVIRGTATSASCYNAEEVVVWKNSDLVNTSAIGNNLTKFTANGAWNGGASSHNTVSAEGYFRFVATETNKNRMVGLSTTNTNSDFSSIQYAIYLQNNGNVSVYESGANRGVLTTFSGGEEFKISVENNVVKYYKNNNLFYISSLSPTLPLIIDVSINEINGTVTNARVGNFNTGAFTASVISPTFSSPIYQWKLNGTPVGGNSNTYTNNSLANNDVITCEVNPNLAGCSSTLFISNAITNQYDANPAGLDFAITATPSSLGCAVAEEAVRWNGNSLVNVNETSGNLNKIQSNGAWNGGAASLNTVSNDGHLEFTAVETNKNRMIGLSNSNVNSDFTSIQYAIYLQNNATYNVFESGTNRGGFGAFSGGDIFKIAVEGNVVKYYRNGSLFYLSAVSPTLPMLVDVSINETGGTVNNAKVRNYSGGTFTASVGAGVVSPDYQWYLNGVPVGTNSNSYSNGALNNNDVISCELTPNISGCSGLTYPSNSITNLVVSNPTGINFSIAGTVSSIGCSIGEEQVRWNAASIANLNESGGNLSKIQSNGAWNGGAASLNTVSNDGFLQFTATETNKNRMIGLSNTNVNSDYTTIQYAIYLVNSSLLFVYESGTSRGNFGSFSSGDVFKIAVEGAVVKYYRNGSVFYISSIAPTLPLLVDVSINETGGTVTNAIVANYNAGTFTASVSGGVGSPDYQWKLNGANVGTNSNTYTNGSLANNDVVTCVLTPNLNGCGGITYNSNSITNRFVSSPTGINFSIQGTPTVSGCALAEEEVRWVQASLTNVNATANSLIKIQNNGAWDGGAASTNSVSNDGFFQFTATETNKARMAGLSTVNTNSNFNTIQYAVYLLNNGTFQVYESGTGRGSFGTYLTGDVFKITVEASVVKYYKNGTIFYISSIAPTLPLIVDVSINETGGTITNALVRNYNTGTFTASVSGGVVSPDYQWKLNGANVGTNSNTYTNTTLSNNDVITCVLTPNISGCGGITYPSNAITYITVPIPSTVDFYITGTSVSSACKTVEEVVSWKVSSLTNVIASTNNLNKIQNNGAWDGGAASSNSVGNNGYFEFTATEVNRARMAGLSTTNVNSNFTTIQYAWYLRSDGLCEVYESGTSRGNFGAYVGGSVFKVAVESGTVKYYIDDVLKYTSTIAPTLPLLIDVSIRDIGGTISNALVSNYNVGDFTAVAINAGASPTYQWQLNGINVGTNSTSYTNSSLNDGEIITCILTPDIGGCSTTDITSNSITNFAIPAPTGTEFYILGTAASSACNSTNEEVRWRASSIVLSVPSGNNLSRLSTAGGAWNGGAASWNTVANNGYFQFTGIETNTYRMAGLSNTNPDANYTTIQYAWYLRNDGTLEIYESGTSRGGFGAYTANSIFKIAVEAGVVKYYHNGVLRYTSLIAPTLPLLVDVSIYSPSGTISNALVSNLSIGDFTAVATNAGASPSYQWLLNGSNVGTNSNTYSNTFLSNGDVVTCQLTPDLGGCSSTTYSSNTITNIQVASPTSVEFVITGTAASTGCNIGREEVRWLVADLVNVTASNNNLFKTQSNGAWNGGAASRNSISNNGSFEFTATETNLARMAGLSTTNVNSNYTSIQYAWYLRSDGICEIYETGTSRGGFGAYTSGSVFKVAIENGIIRYYLNGTLRYTSTILPTLPMIADVSIRDIGGTITNAIVTNYNTGVFTATVTNAGAAPTYQWKLNGVNVGTNSNSYTNTTLSNGDIISCDLTPDLTGCGATIIPSNNIVNNEVNRPIGVEFYIVGTAAPSGCIVSAEEVVWKNSDLVNVLSIGNSLRKFQSNGAWNGGAASFNTVSNNGYLEFTATETNTYRMCGLSTSNVDGNYTSIQFAWYLRNDGTLQIYESGTARGTFGSYVSGDKFKITVESNVVKYYKNGTLSYISLVAPTLPLVVDASIYTIDGTITNAITGNYNTGTFTATASGAGASPTYQWKLNGANVGSNSNTYVNTTLTNNDIISCELGVDIVGCSSADPVVSNYISNSFSITQTPIEFYVEASSTSAACNTAEEEVVWKISDLSNVTASGNDLVKVQSGGAWNGGAGSWNTVKNNGFLQFTAIETNTARMGGLSTSNPNSNFTTIQYAWYLRTDGTAEIYESGSSRGNFGAYGAGAIFKIAVESNVVKYYLNGVLRYTSTISPTLPLMVDVSINTLAGTISNAIISNYYSGTFTANATNAGAAPDYQWKLNGINVGTNSATYSNTSLVDNDVVTCILTPDVSGCSSLGNLSSNAVTNKSIPTLQGTEIYVRGTATLGTCNNVVSEEVVWSVSGLQNVIANGNDLLKNAANGAWNGGAFSYNTVSNNGYLEFTATETNLYRMCGLSTSSIDGNYTTIQYAWYLRNDGTVQVYESGTARGTFGGYSAGMIFKISVESNIVKYYKNGVLMYTSLVAPTLPLIVDASLYSINATITNAIVVNNNTGTFTVVATNVGASPTYQWKVNGVNSGTNSTTYVNTNLQLNDVVSCEVTPDASGCNTASYPSNNVTVITSGNPVVAGITGTTTFCLGATSQLANVTPGGTWSSSNASVATVDALGLVTSVSAGISSITYTVTSGSCSADAVTTVTVEDIVPVVSILESANNICQGASSTITATANNIGGGTVNYDFKVDGVSVQSSNANTYVSTGFANGEVVTCEITIAGGSCLNTTTALSNSITMIVNNNATPTVSISTPITSLCSSGSATFTATASNTAGGIINYNFKINGNSVQSGPINTYSSASIANGNTVTCDITVTGGTCLVSNNATSNSIVMTVNTNSTPSVSINSTATTLCSGNTVTVTATALNTAGGTVTYTFLKNGVSVQSGLSNTYTSSTLGNGNTISCNINISGGTCLTSSVASSNVISFTVNTPGIVLSSSGSTVCSGANVIFTAAASNISGAGSVTYNFRRNGITVQSGTSTTYSTGAYANGDVFTCQLVVTGGVCLSPVSTISNGITINALNTSVSISPSANPICSGTSVTFTATASNTGGGVITYTFRRNGSTVQSGAANTYTTSTIANGNSFSCSISVTGGSCGSAIANSNAVVMTVNAGPTPTISITETQFNLCSGGIDFSSVVTNEGPSPDYQWKLNGVDIPGEINSFLIQSGLVDGDLITCELTSSLACVSGATVLSNTINVNLTGSQTTWLGISNVWNAPSNWSNGVPNSSVSVIIPAGTPFHPAALAPAFAYDLTINPGATLEISGSSVLGLYGNLINNGTFIPNTGTLSFLNCSGTGPTPHILTSGTGVETNFFNLTLDDASGLSLAESISVDATLAVTNGNFNTGAEFVTLNSNATRTGRIGQLLVGTFTGNIVQKRFIPGPTTGWALLGTSVTNASIAQWTDDFPTSGFIGSTGWAGGFISIYHYDEVPGGLFDAVASYVPITNATNALVSGKGYWVYLGTALNTTTDITSDVTGTPAMGTINLGITYSDSGNPTEDGWNLVANPYPSTINWDAGGWTKSNIDGAVYIYNADNQQYATYASGVGTNGGSNLIANSQGFYVKANNLNPQLIGNETVKINQTATFIRTTDPENVLRLTLSNDDLTDEAIIRFDNQATLSFDKDFDAVKRISKLANYPSLSVVNDNQNLSICALPKGLSKLSLPLMTGSTNAGNYTLSWKINSRFEEAYCMILEDLLTGTRIDMKAANSYSFELTAGIQNRLVIHSNHALPTIVEHPSCNENKKGKITFINQAQQFNQIELHAENGNLLEKAEFSSESYSFENLKPGNYEIIFKSSGACGSLVQMVNISGNEFTEAALSTNLEMVELNLNESVEISPNPVNGSIIKVDFGDGTIVEGIAQKEKLQHQYNTEGNYTIRIVSVNGNCSDSKEIEVSVSNNELFAVKQLGDELQLTYNFENPTNVDMKIVNGLGSVVMEGNLSGLKSGKQNLNISNYKPGVYFVSFSYDQKLITRKIVK